MAKPIDIQDVRLQKGRALPVTTMNPHPAAKVPADAYLISEKVPETAVVNGVDLILTLLAGTNWTVMQVEVWRSGAQTNADEIVFKRGTITAGGHYNVISLTGAELQNHHSNTSVKINCNFTDTVGIWVTYWYS